MTYNTDDMSAEQLRVAIEIIFRKDYFETEMKVNLKLKTK